MLTATERAKEYNHRWRLEHKAHIKKYNRSWSRKHPGRSKQWYQEHLELGREANRKRRRRTAGLISDFRKNGCSVCGKRDRLHAHHLSPGSKKFQISRYLVMSPSVVRRELKKCVCLCVSCHSKIHGKTLVLISATARAYSKIISGKQEGKP